jgi:hypothetical protein
VARVVVTPAQSSIGHGGSVAMSVAVDATTEKHHHCGGGTSGQKGSSASPIRLMDGWMDGRTDGRVT